VRVQDGRRLLLEGGEVDHGRQSALVAAAGHD
jgi:hypothetical protein